MDSAQKIVLFLGCRAIFFSIVPDFIMEFPRLKQRYLRIMLWDLNFELDFHELNYF